MAPAQLLPAGRLDGVAIRTRPREPLVLLDRAEVSVAAGIAGDFRGASPRRQVTALFAADWAAALAMIEAEAPWTIRRANLLVSGLANPRAAGGVLRVGAARLIVTGETTPCSRMEAALPGLRRALTPLWRGGLTMSVLTAGEIAVGDEVVWEG